MKVPPRLHYLDTCTTMQVIQNSIMDEIKQKLLVITIRVSYSQQVVIIVEQTVPKNEFGVTWSHAGLEHH